MSSGNIRYLYLTSRGDIKGVRNVGGNEFFYLTEERARDLGIPGEYLYPLLPSSRYMRFFVFRKDEWEDLKKQGGECYLFLCRKPRRELPESVRRYIEMAEGPNAIIRLRRRPGEREGRPVSESLASQTRKGHKQFFVDWYDLGGVIDVSLFTPYYAQYLHRFALIEPGFKVALDADFIAFKPKEGFELVELKALLAYLNSSFTQLAIEVRGRTTGGGMLAIEVEHAKKLPILNVKKLNMMEIKRLADLFDKLESEARRLGGADRAENIYGSELAMELTGRSDVRRGVQGLFNTVIYEIDREVARILGLGDAAVEDVRKAVLELAKRRLSRVGEARVDAIRGSEEQAFRKAKKRAARGGSSTPVRRLDEFFRRA